MTNTAVWSSVSGDGEPLVALHPGGTDSRAMEPLLAEFRDYRRILIDRPGHGRCTDSAGPWSFEEMADVVAGVLDELRVDSAHVVGCSDGAIVGLQLALRRPELVRSLVVGAGVFHHEGWRDGVLGGEPPDFMCDAYTELSPDGRDHWPVVVAKSAALHEVAPQLSIADLSRLAMPALVVAGDDDEVRVEHLVEMFEALPDGELAILPRATHGALVEKPDLLARLIRDLHRPAGNGLAPIRRA